MPEPIAICIENCHPVHESLRYLRCTAIAGAHPGLVVSTTGEVHWKVDEPGYCRIWVSGDEKLICCRDPGSPPGARIHRAGRAVELEVKKPVVVIDGDYLLLPGMCYRIHVHGQTGSVHEPGFLDFEEPVPSTLARFAAAGIIAMGALSVGACSRPPGENKASPPVEVRDQPPAQPIPDPGYKPDPPVEVRDHPPEVAPDPEPQPPPDQPVPAPPETKVPSGEGKDSSSGTENSGSADFGMKPGIEVRVSPPKVAPPMRQPKP